MLGITKSTHMPYLEDHPRTCRWLITMVIVGPLRIGGPSPSKWPFTSWLVNGGDPNHLGYRTGAHPPSTGHDGHAQFQPGHRRNLWVVPMEQSPSHRWKHLPFLTPEESEASPRYPKAVFAGKNHRLKHILGRGRCYIYPKDHWTL